MNRLKALYRGQAIRCKGKKLYSVRFRGEWLQQLVQAGLQQRAQGLYEQLDGLEKLRRKARQLLLQESKKHAICARLRTIPFLGPIRVALLVARVQMPHRFRSKRQFWAYCGLALETRSSADYQQSEGKLKRSSRKALIRGLNADHNPTLKRIFKSAAMSASVFPGPWRDFYQERVDAGIRPEMAQLTLARKIATTTLTLWKKGESFDPTYLKAQAA
jgi:transposase